MTSLGALYQAVILEHSKSPHHATPVPSPTHVAERHNPLCGDQFRVSLRIEDGVVRAIGCEVQGCAIARASGSLMSDAIAGRSTSEIGALIEKFLAVAEGRIPTDDALGDLAAVTEARHYPLRRQCATLSWETLQDAVDAQS